MKNKFVTALLLSLAAASPFVTACFGSPFCLFCSSFSAAEQAEYNHILALLAQAKLNGKSYIDYKNADSVPAIPAANVMGALADQDYTFHASPPVGKNRYAIYIGLPPVAVVVAGAKELLLMGMERSQFMQAESEFAASAQGHPSATDTIGYVHTFKFYQALWTPVKQMLLKHGYEVLPPDVNEPHYYVRIRKHM